MVTAVEAKLFLRNPSFFAEIPKRFGEGLFRRRTLFALSLHPTGMLRHMQSIILQSILLQSILFRQLWALLKGALVDTPHERMMMPRLFALVIGCLLVAGGSTSRAQNAWPSVDNPSKLKLLMGGCDPGQDYRPVLGVLATEIDIGQDSTIEHEIMNRAVKFAQEQCPRSSGFRNIAVQIHHGDPTSFTEERFNYKKSDMSKMFDLFRTAYPVKALEGRNYQPVNVRWTDDFYKNWDTARRESAQKAAQDAEEQRAKAAESARIQLAEQAAKQAEQAAKEKEKAEVSTRSAAFVTANGVKHFLTVKQLTANPFVYQGQVVAVYVIFGRMNSATEGVFGASDRELVLVSAIPSARFTQSRSKVMLAGRVLGNQEIKLPLLGPTLVPHLAFVGSAFCQKPDCLDYAINLK
jgi:hypothetical protein